MEAFVDVRARNVLIDVMYDSNSVGMIDDDFRAEHSVVQERADDASVAIDDDPEDDGPKARAAARDPGGPRGGARAARILEVREAELARLGSWRGSITPTRGCSERATGGLEGRRTRIEFAHSSARRRLPPATSSARPSLALPARRGPPVPTHSELALSSLLFCA